MSCCLEAEVQPVSRNAESLKPLMPGPLTINRCLAATCDVQRRHFRVRQSCEATACLPVESRTRSRGRRGEFAKRFIRDWEAAGEVALHDEWRGKSLGMAFVAIWKESRFAPARYTIFQSRW